jgi:dipeptidyl-peptidase-3
MSLDDEIRQNDGFKNVTLGNCILAQEDSKESDIPFLNPDDSKLMREYSSAAFDVKVGLHELLGHGSGKMFFRELDGSFNFPADLKNPLTGDKISSWYERGESYDQKFVPIGSSYEECRADTTALHLSFDDKILE